MAPETRCLGARIAGAARAGEVLVSSTVPDLVAGSGIGFEDAGRHELKGIPEPWQLVPRCPDQSRHRRR